MALQDILAELAVNLRLDSTQFSQGVAKAEASTNRLDRRLQGFAANAGKVGKAMTGLAASFGVSFGVGAIAGVVAAANAGLQYAASLGEMAEQLGVTTRELQVYRYIATQSGISQESMDKGLARLTLTIGKAAAGSKQAQVGFNALGLSVRNADGSIRTAGELLPQIADKYKKVDSAASRAALTFQFFGKAGQNMSRLLSGGSAEIEALARAADELGIVLSDEQIQKADQTADKLDALKTVMSARIAGIVADNSDAIVNFADSLAYLVGKIGDAIMAWRNFNAEFQGDMAELRGDERNAAIYRGQAYVSGQNPSRAGRSVSVKLDPAKPLPLPKGGDGLGQFLGGGGGKGKADRSAEEAQRKRVDALRDAHQAAEEQARAEEAILSASLELSRDLNERNAIELQILDAQRGQYKAQLDYEVALNQLTKGEDGKSQAQADALLALYDQADTLRRQAENLRHEEERQRQFNDREAHTFSLQQERLSAEAALAETASERRVIELKILELAYRERRERLERIVQESTDWQERQKAEQELAGLARQQQLDRQGVLQGTRGPMEDYLAGLPTTAAKAQEALERLQVQGFEGLIDSALALSDGIDAAAESLLETLKTFLLGLLRMELQKGLASVIGSNPGGLFAGLFGGARAAGGPVLSRRAYLVGEQGPEIFMPGSSGRIISNDNARRMAGSGRGDVNVNVYGVTDLNSFNRGERQIARAAKRRLGLG